ncbi:MAG TPA: tetratricopeptide repeat protein [Streptosporangiaceae bacterium]
MTGRIVSFAAQLRQGRLAAGLTQEELAERSGLSVRAIRDLESGRTDHPRLSTIRQLSRALCLDIAGQHTLAAARVPGTAAAARPRELPAAVTNFTGRERELARLTAVTARAVIEHRQTVVISAIGGTAGVGKTALALEWAHRAARGYPDGQLYVDLRGYDAGEPLPAVDALAWFLRSLGMAPSDIPAGQEERAARYRTLLAGQRVLVVLDNAISAEQVRPLLPGSSGCVAVVTSRDPLTGLVARDGAVRLDLDLLPLTDAVNLLRTLIGARVEDDPRAASELALACCRLPLALRVAAELAASRPGARLSSLAAELADQQRGLDLLDTDGDVRASARAVFSWSYRSLSTATARAFRLLGLHPGPDFDSYALGALTGSTAEQARRYLDQLARASLILPAGAGRYCLHDLLRAYACELVTAHDDDRHAALTRLFDHYLHAAGAAMDRLFPAELHRRPRIPVPGSPAPVLDDTGAARAWLDAHRSTLTVVATYTAEHGWPRHTTQLAATLARHLDAGRHYIEAVTIHGSAHTAAQRLGDHAAEATALFSLGLAGTRQGRYQQATAYSREALGLYRRAGDLTGQARALSNLGNISARQGRYREAAAPFREALALFREMGDATGQAHTLSNLGFIDQRLARYQRASRYLRQALELCRANRDTMGEAYTLASLGCLCRHQQRYERAAEYLEQALELCRAIDERTCEAHTLADLGLVELDLGRHDQAADNVHQALVLFRASGDQSGEAEALNSLAAVRLGMNRAAEARAGYAEALILARHIGDQHEQARAHEGLACAYQADGVGDHALDHWQQALTLYTAIGVPRALQLKAQVQAQPGRAGDAR